MLVYEVYTFHLCVYLYTHLSIENGILYGFSVCFSCVKKDVLSLYIISIT